MSSNNPWVIQAEINRATYQAQFWDNPVYNPPVQSYSFSYNTTMSLQDGLVINNQPLLSTGPRVVTPDITGQRFYNAEAGETVRIMGRSPYGAGDVWEAVHENSRQTPTRVTERNLYREWLQL